MATNNSGKQLSSGRKDEKVKHSSSGYLPTVSLWEDLGKLHIGKKKKTQKEKGAANVSFPPVKEQEKTVMLSHSTSLEQITHSISDFYTLEHPHMYLTRNTFLMKKPIK